MKHKDTGAGERYRDMDRAQGHKGQEIDTGAQGQRQRYIEHKDTRDRR